MKRNYMTMRVQERSAELRGIDIGVGMGKEQHARETAISLKKLGVLSLQQIADAVGFDLTIVEKWLSPATAN